MLRASTYLLVLFNASLLSGCTQLGPVSRLEGKWQGEQDLSETAGPVVPFDPSLEFEFEFKSDKSLRAKLPTVGVVYGTWKVQDEQLNGLDLMLSYSNDGKSRYVQPLSVRFEGDAFIAQPPGAPGPVRFSRVK